MRARHRGRKGCGCPHGESGHHGYAHGGRIHHLHQRGEGEAAKERHDRPTRGRAAGGGRWIQGAIKHPGALRRALHVPAGKKIPIKKLEKAAHSSNPTLRRRAILAKTLKSFH